MVGLSAPFHSRPRVPFPSRRRRWGIAYAGVAAALFPPVAQLEVQDPHVAVRSHAFDETPVEHLFHLREKDAEKEEKGEGGREAGRDARGGTKVVRRAGGTFASCGSSAAVFSAQYAPGEAIVEPT